MSVYDDGMTDLDGAPALPATEARGGRAVDWNAVRPGEPLPELSTGEGEEPSAT